MRRYWIEPEFFNTDSVIIKDESFHHIITVCRRHIGDKFEVLNEGGQAFEVELVDIRKSQAIAKIISQRMIPPLPNPLLTLAISLPKFPVMDAVIEKASEMGAFAIQPFVSEFSHLRSVSSFPKEKYNRWNKIALSAAQQSGRASLIKIHPVKTLNDVLREFNPSPTRLGLFAYEGSSTLGIKRFLKEAAADNPHEVIVFVGSEGGFSDSEVQQFQQHKLEPITLGDQVLRVETACITLLAILKYELGTTPSAGG